MQNNDLLTYKVMMKYPPFSSFRKEVPMGKVVGEMCEMNYWQLGKTEGVHL